ncbi:MAG: C40 family peptidase [Gammaproteobacteria bacterium]|nr:C40 family peptidase [Gammaproteobacteria bacterium]
MHFLRHAPGVRAWLLPIVAVLCLGGCLSTTPPRWQSTGPPAGHGTARAELLRIAANQIGTPYRYGGNDRRGFDCSGLVQYTHRHIGVAVPRTTAQQWSRARTPDRRHLLPGDLVFFDIGGRSGRHVGIYEGGGVFIHAPSSGKRVSRASLDNPYWRRRMIGARTFL